MRVVAHLVFLAGDVVFFEFVHKCLYCGGWNVWCLSYNWGSLWQMGVQCEAARHMCLVDLLGGLHAHCPNCNCCDIFGSVSRPMGGLFGRADAYYGSKECQKAGSLHLHMLLFVQALHQHSSVAELLQSCDGNTLSSLYRYKANTDSEVYVDPTNVEKNQDLIEADWKTGQLNRTHLLLRATPDTNSTAELWSKFYRNIVQKTQQLVNHHMHPKDPVSGEHQVLTGKHSLFLRSLFLAPEDWLLGCKTKAAPKECRGRYPRML